MGAEPCDVTACRASDKWALTRAIDKSKSRCLNFKHSLLFFSLLSGRLLSDSCLMQSRLIYYTVPVGI